MFVNISLVITVHCYNWQRNYGGSRLQESKRDLYDNLNIKKAADQKTFRKTLKLLLSYELSASDKRSVIKTMCIYFPNL